MTVKLLIEQHLVFLCLIVGCTGSVYTCQNATLLEITCRGTFFISITHITWYETALLYLIYVERDVSEDKVDKFIIKYNIPYPERTMGVIEWIATRSYNTWPVDMVSNDSFKETRVNAI